MSVAADKGYDTADFVAGVRALGVTPHVAAKKRCSAIDGRTSRHAGYATSQRRRKLIEEGYGWMKDIGGLRKLRHRGQAKVSRPLYLHLRGLQPGAPAKTVGGASCGAQVKPKNGARQARQRARGALNPPVD